MRQAFVAARFSIIVLIFAGNGTTSRGAVVPFTEDFAASASNWRDSTGINQLTWNPSGGQDGGAFASSFFNFSASNVNDTPLVFRAQDEFGSSGNAFVGDWVAGDIAEFGVFVRHNSTAPILFFARFAGSNNFPAANALGSAPVLPNTWTELKFPLPYPSMVFEGPFTFDQVFNNIGHVQVGILVPAILAGQNATFAFDIDKVRISKPALAIIVNTDPQCEKTLWRIGRNTFRLTFDQDIVAPAVGALSIQEALPGGSFGPDLSANFIFTIEGGSVLRVRDSSQSLAHRKWYAIHNLGEWAGVCPFSIQFQALMGDANNDGIVSQADVDFITAGIGPAISDNDRRDIDGNGFVNFTDVLSAQSFVPSTTAPKPSGHQCDQGSVCDAVTQIEICDNGIDDDGDGLVDCADDDCFNPAPGRVEKGALRGQLLSAASAPLRSGTGLMSASYSALTGTYDGVDRLLIFADDDSLGSISRLVPPTSTAAFYGVSATSGFPCAVFSLDLIITGTSPHSANAHGELVITDVTGDVLSANVSGAWLNLAGTANFSGAATNLIFTESSGDGLFQGNVGAMSTIFSQAGPYHADAFNIALTGWFSNSQGQPAAFIGSATVAIGGVFPDAADIDLIVSSVKAPAVVPDGEVITLEWTVENQGSEPAIGTLNGGWLDHICLNRPDSNMQTACDYPLPPFVPQPGGLIAGGTYTKQQEVIIPAGLSGDYYFVIDADVQDNLTEPSGEGNNRRVAAAPTFIVQSLQPDLNVANGDVTVTPPGSIFNTQSITIAWTARNIGQGTANGGWIDQLYRSDDDVLDVLTDTLVQELPFSGIRGPGTSYSRSATIGPPPEGDYWFFIITDATDAIGEADEDNNVTERAIAVLAPSYGADVQASITEAISGTTVRLSGQATSLLAPFDPVPGVPVSLRIRAGNTRRVTEVLTDSQGDYFYDFLPLSNEAGLYDVFADHPVVMENPAQPQDQFVLVGMTVQPAVMTQNITVDQERQGSVTLRNLGNTHIFGIEAVVDGRTDYLTASATAPDSLVPNASGMLNFTLSPTGQPDPPNAVTPVIVRIRAQVNGTPTELTSLTLNVYISPQQPNLVISPSQLEANMVLDGQSQYSFTISNTGGAAATNVQVKVPCAPNLPCTQFPTTFNCVPTPAHGCTNGLWLNLASPSLVGDIAPGESKTVDLTLNPASTLVPGNYNGAIGIEASNAPSTNVPFIFRAISTQEGSVLVCAEDELTYYGSGGTGSPCRQQVLPGALVEGATVQLFDAVNNALVVKSTTDASGTVTLANLLEGPYRLEVTAPNHGTATQTIQIHAGQETKAPVFLASQQVTYEWTVEPTDIPDEYIITITVDFETDVPIPKVIVEPALITLDLAVGEVRQVDIYIANRGLIAAQDVKLVVTNPPGYEITPLITDIGTLLPTDPASDGLNVPLIVHRAAARTAVGSATAAVDCSSSITSGVSSSLDCDVTRHYWTPFYFDFPVDCPSSPPVGGNPPPPSAGGDGGGDSDGGGGSGGNSSPSNPYFNPPVLNIQSPQCEPDECPGGNCDCPNECCAPPCCDPDVQCCEGPPDTNNGPPDRPEADPILYFNGEFVMEFEDIRIPGRGTDFVWSRQYRSRLGTDSAHGKNWDFFYNKRIEREGADAVVSNGRGRRDRYPSQSGDKWGRDGFQKEVRRLQDGSYAIEDPARSVFTFRPTDTSALSGRVASRTDRNGNTLVFGHDPEGRLRTVTDTLGREIQIAYNADELVDTVTDFAGRQVHYEYYQDGDAGGSAGDLKSVTTPPVIGTPNGNDFPNGKTTVYTYTKGFADERLNHNLLSITDGNGKTYVRNIYHPTEDPADPNFDRVVRQVWGDDGDVVDIFYIRMIATSTNGNAVLRAIVNDRVGNVTEYDYDVLNHLVRKREYTGRANPDQPTTLGSNRPTGKLRAADPEFFETRYEYNADAAITKITHSNGNVTEYVRELEMNPDASRQSRANVREMRHLPGVHTPVGDQAMIVEKFEYDDNLGCCGFNVITKHIDPRGHVTEHDYDTFGNRIQTRHPIPAVIEDFEYNEFGQMTAHILPDNGSGHRRRDEMTYYDGGPQQGYLQSRIVDAGGYGLTTTFEYDAVGNVIRQVDPRGNDTQYIVNALNQIVREVSREVEVFGGAAIRYVRDTFYDANNNVVRVDDQNIDDQGNFVVDNPTLTTTFEYETLNNLIRKTEEVDEALNIVTEYEYDANRNRTLTRFGEAVAGRQPDNVVRTHYDERDLPFQIIRGAGGPAESVMQYDYDGNRNRIAELHGMVAGLTDHVTLYQFDAYDRLVEMTDPMGNVTNYGYDAGGNRLSTIVQGELDDVPGSAGNIRLSEVHEAYDELNRSTRTEQAFFDARTQAPIADGLATSTTDFSPNSQIVRTTDGNGNETLTAYDTANRRGTVTDAKGNTVTYAYDANSNVTSITEVEKSDLGTPDETFVTTNEYDALDRLMATTDNIGNTNRSFYDSRSNRTRAVDARGNVVHFDYDGLDRQTRTVRVMTDTGDGTGTQLPGEAGMIITSQIWDDTSRLVGQTDDNGNTTTYVYDGLNRKVGEVYADGTRKTLDLDIHGNAVFWTDGNQNQVMQVFDAADRKIAVDVIPGPGVSNDTTFEVYKYDGLSRLIHAEDDDSIVTRAYDSLSHVTEETQQYLDEAPPVVRAEYDAEGNLLMLNYPGGRVVETTFDELNRKKLILDQGDAGFIAEYFYKGPSRVERRDYGNNTRLNVSYDGARRTTRTRHSAAGVTCASDRNCPEGNTCEVATGTCIIDDRTYAWDPAYNKTQMADVRPGGPQEVRDYTYDSVSRLIMSQKNYPSGSVKSIAYNLDGVGNRIHVKGGPDSGQYIMDTRGGDFVMNQYSATPFDGRSYDANGNLIEVRDDDDFGRFGDFDLADFARLQACLGQMQPSNARCASFDADGDGAISVSDWTVLSQAISAPIATQSAIAYDCANRQVAILNHSPTQRIAYHYDTLGRRVALAIDSPDHTVLRRYFSLLHQELAETGYAEPANTYVYGTYIDDLLQTSDENGASSFAHTDQSFTISRTTTSDASITSTYEFGDFGQLVLPRYSASHSFTGRRFDEESGNLYFRSRYMDPAAGRFLTRDSIGTWGDVIATGNSFTYAGNNPLTYLDPYGLACIVQLCKRQLEGSGGNYLCPLCHHFLRIGNDNYGYDGFIHAPDAPSKDDQDSIDKGTASCETLSGVSCESVRMCINRDMKNKRRSYCPLTWEGDCVNCQGWTTQMLECSKGVDKSTSAGPDGNRECCSTSTRK